MSYTVRGERISMEQVMQLFTQYSDDLEPDVSTANYDLLKEKKEDVCTPLFAFDDYIPFHPSSRPHASPGCYSCLS